MKRFVAFALAVTLIAAMAVTAFAQHERPPEIPGVAEGVVYDDTFPDEAAPQPDGEQVIPPSPGNANNNPGTGISVPAPDPPPPIDLTDVILGIFALIGTIVTTIIVPYIQSKTTKQQQDNIENWARIAALAAEESFKDPGSGDQKYFYVTTFLQSLNLKVSEATLDAMIQAAVKMLRSDIFKEETA